MISQLSQESITEYSSIAQTISAPTGTDYTQGVQVGKTIPAKWWNWLFRAVTKRAEQARTDAGNMLAELKNTVTDAGLTPDPTDNTQLSQAADIIAVNGVSDYVTEKKRGFFTNWTSETCTGFPAFSNNDVVTVEVLKPIRNSENKAFYLCLKQHASDPIADYYWHFTSTDLLNWHEISAPAGAKLQTADIIYYKDRYYFLYSVEDVHNAQLYYSDDAASWYFSRSFSEYGALGLRVAGNILWMISASAQTYADINYYSYKTTDGVSWTNAGVVFRNTGNTEDSISEVVPYLGSYILGNKITVDGSTWAQIVTDWSNSAYARVFVGNNGIAVLQFNDSENAWYTMASPQSAPVQRLGTWSLKQLGPENYIVAEDTSDNYAGISNDGVTFTKLSILYPTKTGAEFFRCGDYYFLGNYKSDDLETWVAVTLPLGATILQYSSVGYYIIAGNFFSNDFCENWVQGMAAGSPFCAVPVYVSDTSTCMINVVRDNIVLRRMTFNSVNRVIGTTLYLK